MTQIYDLSNNEINYLKAGTYGGNAGNKDAVFWDNATWMIKYPKTTKSMDVEDISYTTAPLSEYIGSHVYNILGFDVHKTELAFRNDKIVVACEDFCDDDSVFKEIRTIKNMANKSLAAQLDEHFSSTSDNTRVDLEELLLHLKYNDILSSVDGINERFWDMIVIDVLINNNDRNNGNWGLLYKGGKHTLAPIFDNGAAFSNKFSDEKIKSILYSDEKMINSALNGTTIFDYRGKKLTAKKILYFDNEYLKSSLFNLVPLISDKLYEIKSFIEQIPESYNGIAVCSPERKRFYFEGMKIRLDELLIQRVNDFEEIKEHPGRGAR